MGGERELTSPVDLALPDGRLDRAALGWARHPLQRCNLGPGLSRVARWSYWCITGRAGALTLLLADVGFAGVALVSFVELDGGRPVDRVHVRPGGLRPAMPDTAGGDLRVDARRLRLSLATRGEEMAVTGEARTLLGARIEFDLTVARPRAQESINVVVPWDDLHYHLTSKQQGLPARGVVRVSGREHRFGPESQGFACLDYGRGRWPGGIAWDWAFAGVTQPDGRTVGLNLGARWTDGTGITENGFVVDGRVHKLAEPVSFAYDRRDFRRPWRIAGPRVDLRFDPLRERAVVVPLGLALHQCLGRFSGTLVDDAGAAIVLAGVLGVAESVRARWSL